MVDVKHTPGPWRRKKPWRHIVGTRGGPICYDVSSVANCHLIAAAPDMLEALKAAREPLSDAWGAQAESVLRIVDAAIAKAEGRDA